MSMEDYETGIARMLGHPDEMDFVGPRDEALISKAEQVTGHRFPPTYRRFLLAFGAGGFGSQEIYGVIRDDFETSGVPDAVWYNLRLRRDCFAPDHLFAVHSFGDGELACLDFSSLTDDECPVVGFLPSPPPHDGLTDFRVDDFGALLATLVDWELNGEA
jgi:antitoxin YobK